MSTYTIPNVIAEHPRGDRIMDVYSHLLTERILYLGTPIDAGVANALTAQLLYLEGSSPEQEINLYINCEGGDMMAMLAVYDTMQCIKSPVVTTCVGQAIAAGAVLLAAGAPGRRGMLPHARVVLHQPSASGRGTIPDLILAADEVVRIRADDRVGPVQAHRPVGRDAARRHRPGPRVHGESGPGLRARRPGADRAIVVRRPSRAGRPGRAYAGPGGTAVPAGTAGPGGTAVPAGAAGPAASGLR